MNIQTLMCFITNFSFNIFYFPCFFLNKEEHTFLKRLTLNSYFLKELLQCDKYDQIKFIYCSHIFYRKKNFSNNFIKLLIHYKWSSQIN